MATGIRSVAATMSEIATSGAEQSTGLQEITTAVRQLDQITQHNAQMVEHAVEQARALEGRASTLSSAVESFRLQQGTADEAVALVERAVSMRSGGSRDQFLRSITDKNQPFHDRDMYVFALDSVGTYLAFGGNSAKVGTRVQDIPGIAGEQLVQDIIAQAERGPGWVEYDINNPATGKVENLGRLSNDPNEHYAPHPVAGDALPLQAGDELYDGRERLAVYGKAFLALVVAFLGPVRLCWRPGIPARGGPAGIDQRHAIDRAHRDAQFATRAMLWQHGVHELVRAHDGIGRAGRDAQFATRAMLWSTVCMSLFAPTMASAGQALMHRVQPMHQSSSISTTLRGPSTPKRGSRGCTAHPVIAASRTMPCAPPGGHWLIPASPVAMACA